VTDTKVLITARLRLMSRPAHMAAAFSAATSGARMFSRAAPSSSASIAGDLLQIRADRRGFFPHPATSMLASATLIRPAASGRDSLATTSFSMNVSTGSAWHVLDRPARPAAVVRAHGGDGGDADAGQLLQLPVQRQHVALDRHHVVRAPAGDDLRGVKLGVH